MIHKAFILGAGLGTRLRPLTHVLPKPLVPIFHEPLANYALRHCRAAGITEFAINTHHLPETWATQYPDAHFMGAPLHFFHEPTLLETGGGLRNIARFIGNEPLLVYNGDILTTIDVTALIAAHQASGNVATLALRSTGENCNVNISGARVTDLRNTLDDTPGTHQFTGVYCVEPEIIAMLPDDEVVSIIPAFIRLIQQQQLGAVVLDQGDWFDIGTIDAYHAIHQHLRRERNDAIHPAARIHPGAQIETETCIIGPHATIPSGARLRNTIVWPHASVEENSIHQDAIIPHSCS